MMTGIAIMIMMNTIVLIDTGWSFLLAGCCCFEMMGGDFTQVRISATGFNLVPVN